MSIYETAEAGNIEAVKQHLAACAEVNSINKYGEIPLHSVSGSVYNKEFAELLIAKGAEVNAIIKLGHFEGRTPLDFVIARNSTKNTDLFRKNSAARWVKI